jgi:hypothetical protein
LAHLFKGLRMFVITWFNYLLGWGGTKSIITEATYRLIVPTLDDR